MKNIFIKVSILLAMVLLGFSGYSQEKVIQGVVTTFDSIAVIGAEVWVKSTKQIVKTDTLGRFSVAVLSNDKLKVKAKGFNTAKVNLTKQAKLVAVNLQLKPGKKAREYAIGYGYVNDRDKLNAMSQITKDDIDFSQYTSIHELIRGRFAGVQVLSNGDIQVRGVNSFHSSTAALIVVDGVPVSSSTLSSIVPSSVKSVNVLKDGGSSIYGTRGANGVVLIETKKGGDE